MNYVGVFYDGFRLFGWPAQDDGRPDGVGLGDAVLVQLGADLRLIANGAQGVDPGGAQAEGSGGQEDVLHRTGGVLDAVGVALIVGD